MHLQQLWNIICIENDYSVNFVAYTIHLQQKWNIVCIENDYNVYFAAYTVQFQQKWNIICIENLWQISSPSTLRVCGLYYTSPADRKRYLHWRWLQCILCSITNETLFALKTYDRSHHRPLGGLWVLVTAGTRLWLITVELYCNRPLRIIYGTWTGVEVKKQLNFITVMS